MRKLYFNGNLLTLDPRQPKAEAVLVEDGSIARVGDSEKLLKIADDCEKIDLGGRLMLPAFQDSHLHVFEMTMLSTHIDVEGAKSVAEVQDTIRKAIQEVERDFYIAAGWNEHYFEQPRFISCKDLDEVSDEIPMMALRRCRNIAVLNTPAIKIYRDDLMGIYKEYPDGVDVADGEPTGLIKGTVPISRISPKIQRKDMEEGLISLASKFYSAGITTVHTDDFTSASMDDVLDVYFSLIRSGKMPIRIVEQARVIEAEDMDKYLRILEKNPDIDSRWFKGRVMKVVLDGTLGARTCFVREPFADSEGCGIFIYDEAFLRSSFKRAVENGLQIVAHAIGDGAISKALEIFEELKEEFNSVDPRHGIIHNQLLREDHFGKIASLGVVSMVQPMFISSDYEVAEQAVGPERAKTAYNWKTLVELGGVVTSGSDAPIEDFDPINNIHVLVNRTDANGLPAGGWHPEEKFTVEEAIYTYTLGAAHLSFSENEKGSITPGKVADFAVLSDDITEMPSDRIREAKVDLTIMNGDIVYRRES